MAEFITRTSFPLPTAIFVLPHYTGYTIIAVLVLYGWVGRRTSDRKVASSTPGRALSSQRGQLSLPSLPGRQIEYQSAWLGLDGRVHLCRVAGNTL